MPVAAESLERAPRPDVRQRWFRAMGTVCHVVVVGGPPGMVDRARAAISELERRWSRFLPDSELSRLNRLAGRPVIVSADTYEAVSRAIDGWWSTAGSYDPTILPALEALGYDRSFRRIVAAETSDSDSDSDSHSHSRCPRPAPGCAAIRLLPSARAVLLPAGVSVDLGGIGKGLAADMVATRLLAAGAAGVSINIGGDVRVDGQPPSDEGWLIGIEHPFRPGTEAARVRLESGAVVTTSPLLRRWRHGGCDVHHLIDPTTGCSATSTIAAVTVIGGDAAGAEIAAKAAFLGGIEDGLEFVERNGLAAVAIDVAGDAHMTPSVGPYLA